MSRAFRLGITGKIGSGKSLLASLLRQQGINILDADTLAKTAMLNDKALQQSVTELFGAEAYVNGELNRPFIADKIFADDELRLRLEEAVHPVVWKQVLTEFDKARAGSIIGLESALLLHTGYDEYFDLLIYVDASDEVIISRTPEHNRADIKRRLTLQTLPKELTASADLIIDNNGSMEEFIANAHTLAALIRIRALQPLTETPLRMLENDEI